MGVKIIARIPVCPGLKTVRERRGPQPQRVYRERMEVLRALHGVLEIREYLIPCFWQVTLTVTLWKYP